MKHFLLLAIALFCFTQQVDAQINRFHTSTPPVRSTYIPKTYDGTETVKLATRIYEQRKEAAIQKCLTQYADLVENAQDNEHTDVEVLRPYSEWVKSLRMVVIGEYGFVVMRTSTNDRYVFMMDETTWSEWKLAPSKGVFYNQKIRKNERLSMYGYCERTLQ